MLKAKRAALLVKPEATYGTDAVPTGAANAFMAKNVNINPLEQIYDTRDFVLPWFGNQGEVVAGQYVSGTFQVELAGSGAAGTAPKYSPAMKAAGMSETLSAGVSATYAMVSAGEVSTDLYFFVDGRKHPILGALMSAKFVMEAGKAPYIEYNFIGLYVTPVDAANPALTLTGWTKPVAFNKLNTTTLTLHGYAIKASKVEIDLGNALDYINRPNTESVRWTDRQTKATFTFEEELIAGKDFWTPINAATDGALSIIHGTAAGNINTFAAANLQITRPKMSQDRGIAMLTVEAHVKPSAAGNDELTLVQT